MPADTVRGEDLPPLAILNASVFAGTFVVLHAFSVDDGETSGSFAAGDTVKLSPDAARALLRDGSIRKADE